MTFSFSNLFESPQAKQESEISFPARKKKLERNCDSSNSRGHKYIPSHRRLQSPFDKSKPTAHTRDHPPPWLSLHAIRSLKVNERPISLQQALDVEVKLLIDYLRPSGQEQNVRQSVIKKYAAIVKSRFPNSKTCAFGSSGNGLYLPWSDVDLLIIDPYPPINQELLSCPLKQGTQSSKLSKLISKFYQSKLSSSLTILKRARVPILKMNDYDSGIAVDISYNVLGGMQAVDAVRSWIASVHGLRELSLVVKLFLKGKGLNEVYTGGLGGYAVVVLCLAFIRLKAGGQKPGRWLQSTRTDFLEFCRYFSSDFDYCSYGIGFTMDDDSNPVPVPFLFDKLSSPFMNLSKPYMLCLQDPLKPESDITKGSTQIQAISSAFFDVVRTIERRWMNFPGGSRLGEENPHQRKTVLLHKNPWKHSLLGDVIFISRDMVRQRDIMKRLKLDDPESEGEFPRDAAMFLPSPTSNNVISAIMMDDATDTTTIDCDVYVSADESDRNDDEETEVQGRVSVQIETSHAKSVAIQTSKSTASASRSKYATRRHRKPRLGFNSDDVRSRGWKMPKLHSQLDGFLARSETHKTRKGHRNLQDSKHLKRPKTWDVEADYIRLK